MSVISHRIWVFNRYDFDPNHQFDPLALTLSEIDPAWMPEPAAEASQGRYATTPVWQKAAFSTRDLHPHIASMLGTTEGDGRAKVYVLASGLVTDKLVHAGQLFEKDRPVADKKQAPMTLQIRLRPTVAERLYGVHECTAVGLTIHTVVNVRFSSGIGITATELSLNDRLRDDVPFQGWIEEVVHTLGDEKNRMVWRRRDGDCAELAGGEAVARYEFGLGQMIRSLLGEGAEAALSQRRAYTATAVVINRAASPDNEAQMRMTALKVGRGYTADYSPRIDEFAGSFVHAMQNVVHCVSTEGYSCIVYCRREDGKEIEFLKDYINTTLRRNYLAILLLGLHERAWLLRMTQNAGRELTTEWDDIGTDRNALSREAIKELRRDTLRLRVGYRFTRVSQITMHNELNEKVREQLGLNNMLDELDSDLADANEDLRWRRTNLVEWRFRWVGGSAAGFLAATGLFEPTLKGFQTIWGAGVAAFGWAAAGAVLVGFGVFGVFVMLAGLRYKG